MEITRDTVKQWLSDQRRSQAWLAEQCGVSDQAVSNWLREKSPQTISSAAQITIQKLMDQDATEEAAKAPPTPPIQNLVLHPTREQFNKWLAAFKHSEAETLEDWAAEGIEKMAKATIYSQSWPKVAEDTPPYGDSPKVMPPPEPEEGTGTEGK